LGNKFISLLEIVSAFYYSAFHLRPYLSEEKSRAPSTGTALPPSLLGWDSTTCFADPALKEEKIQKIQLSPSAGSKQIYRRAKANKQKNTNFSRFCPDPFADRQQ